MISEIDSQDLKIEEKVYTSLSKTAWDAVLVFGWDNIQYFSGAQLPFLPYRNDFRVCVFWPKNGAPVYLCPPELKSSVEYFGRIGKVVTYDNGGYCSNRFMDAVAALVRESGASVIAVDEKRMSHVYYQKLSERLPELVCESADEWLEDLRMNKTSGEQTLLSEIAYTADHAINGFCHHIMKNNLRSMESNAAALRVHALERGINNIGYACVAQTVAHDMNKEFWPVGERLGANYGFSPDDKCHGDDLVRASINVTYDGYWSDASRPYTYDKPEKWHTETYNEWMKVRNYMLTELQCGKKCSDVWSAVQKFAKKEKIKLVEDHALGHSIGVSVYEKPFIDASDDTVICDGMIFVLTIVVVAKNGELVQSNDTVRMNQGKPEVVNWWKDWREPYFGIAVL